MRDPSILACHVVSDELAQQEFSWYTPNGSDGRGFGPDPCSTQVGLDAAGKTTILYKLKLGEIVTTIPTIGSFFLYSDGVDFLTHSF